MDLQEVGYEVIDWIDLAQGRHRWWTLVKASLDSIKCRVYLE